MKIQCEKTICDCCGADCREVPVFDGMHGHGHMVFCVSAGANCGGSDFRYDFDDLCIRCGITLRDHLRKAIDECKAMRQGDKQ